jgi:hypothetical protein
MADKSSSDFHPTCVNLTTGFQDDRKRASILYTIADEMRRPNQASPVDLGRRTERGPFGGRPFISDQSLSALKRENMSSHIRRDIKK